MKGYIPNIAYKAFEIEIDGGLRRTLPLDAPDAECFGMVPVYLTREAAERCNGCTNVVVVEIKMEGEEKA